MNPKYVKIPVWVWDCPVCGHSNEEREDPFEDQLVCEACGAEFEESEECGKSE